MKIILSPLRGIALLLIIMFVSSCTTRKTFTYLQDVELARTYVAFQDSKVLVRPGDRINVHVSSAFPELAEPLNGGSYKMLIPTMGGKSSPSTTGEMDARAKQMAGYLVDDLGYIAMPVLGKIKVKDKTLSEIKKVITSEIIKGKHLSDPRVEVRFANFQIYLLGAINKGATQSNTGAGSSSSTGNSFFTRINGIDGGVLRVYDKDKINILEALSLCGDLGVEAEINKVNIIRQRANRYVTYRLNLKSADIFSSPGFYLQQDDIIYVEYRYRGQHSVDRAMQLSGYLFSTISTLVSILTLLAIYKK